jgi:hypothetical protein
MKLAAPWITFYNEVKALFEEDPEVKVTFDEEKYELALYVENVRKADALTQLIPEEKTFGNVKVKIKVVPADDAQTKLDLIQEAFYGNPALSYIWSAKTPFGDEFDYVVFENKVVQFYNDNIRDVNGNKSTLYEDIARDVFGEDANLCFCTEAKDRNLIKPLGEWP